MRWETLGYWSETVRRWEGEGLPKGTHPNEYFAHDPNVRLEVDTGFTKLPYHPPFTHEVIEEDERTVTYRDAQGIVKRDRKDSPEMSMPQFVSFPVTCRRDWEEKIKPRLDPKSPERFKDVPELAKKHKDHDYPLHMTICGFYGFPRNLFGEEGLAYALYDQPELIHEMQEHHAAFNIELISRMTEAFDLDFLLIWEDMAFKTGPLISPKMFREFMSPYYEKVIAHARRCGIPHIAVDSDGDNRLLLDLFLEAGVDLMMPFEIAASMDPVPIRAKYGRRLAVWGGIDKRELAKGREAIDRELQVRVAPMLKSGGYIPSVDHSTPPDISFRDYCYFIERVRELGEKICAKA